MESFFNKDGIELQIGQTLAIGMAVGVWRGTQRLARSRVTKAYG
jgi:hypothetical protein